MKSRLFLTSTAALAATLLAGAVHATEHPLQVQHAVNAAHVVTQDPSLSFPDLTITPADMQLAFASHESHSSHASHSSHSSHSSHTSSSFV